MNERERREIITGPLSSLFNLGPDERQNCCIGVCKPNGKWFQSSQKKNPSLLKCYQMMLEHLGKTERYAFGATPRHLPKVSWLTLEWDFTDYSPDEAFVDSCLRTELADLPKELLTLHFKFTGNRSIHLDVFLSQPIPRELGKRLLDCLSWLLCHTRQKGERRYVENGGKVVEFETCARNLSSVMRLPFSRHAKTNGLCRYYGCHDEDALAQYIYRIKPDVTSAGEIEEVCTSMESFLSDSGLFKSCCTSSITYSLTTQQRVYGRGAETYGIHGIQMGNLVKQAAITKSLADHLKYNEFIGYMRDGIPRGHYQVAIFRDKGDFPKFIMSLVGVKSLAHEVLTEISLNGVDEIERRDDRLGRLDQEFRKYFRKWQDRFFLPSGELVAFEWSNEFIERMRQRFLQEYKHKRKVKNLILVLEYCLFVLYSHPDRPIIAVEDVRRKTGISKNTAMRNMRLLQGTNNVLKMKFPSSYKNHLATEYRLNVEFVESVLGRETGLPKPQRLRRRRLTSAQDGLQAGSS